jgi:hypothetical protein
MGLPLFHQRSLFLSPLHFGVASFFHRRSLFSTPLHFWVAFFFIRGLYFLAPCIGVASFFIWGLYFWTSCILGLRLFHWRYLFLRPLHFVIASFFIRGLCFWANERGVWWYPFGRGSGSSERNSHFSNTELAWLAISTAWYSLFSGKEAYIDASGLHGLRIVKHLTPLRASLVRKRVRALSKCINGNLVMNARL